MKKILRLSLIALLGAFLFGGKIAHALDLTFPEKGDLAYAFTIPDDWTHKPDADGNLIVTSANHANSFSLSLGADADMAKMSLEALHKAIFAAAKVKDGDKQESATLDGKSGSAYFGTIDVGSTTLGVKTILIKLDDMHVACLTIISSPKMVPEDQAKVDAVLNSVKFVARK